MHKIMALLSVSEMDYDTVFDSLLHGGYEPRRIDPISSGPAGSTIMSNMIITIKTDNFRQWTEEHKNFELFENVTGFWRIRE